MTDLYPLTRLPLPIRPNVSTVHRWVKRGVRGVRLATVRIGGRIYVSRADLDAFHAAIAAGWSRAVAPTSPSDRAVAAGRELERLGA